MKLTIIPIVLLSGLMISSNSDKSEIKNNLPVQVGADSTKEAEEDFILSRRKLEKEEQFSWFTQGYKEYSPDANTVAKLQELKKHLGFTVFAGSWCSDCHKWLPKFYKTMDEAGIKGSRVKLYGMNRDKKTVAKNNPFETIQDCGVKAVPTFIVFYDNKEVGRIIEKPKSGSLEADILTIAEKAKADQEAERKKGKKAQASE